MAQEPVSGKGGTVGIHPHHELEQIAAELQTFMDRVTDWSGEVYRSATPRYCRSNDLISGLGSAKVGGRWNPPGDLRTVYASLDPETAMAESLATFRYYGWALYEAMPRVFRALEVRLSAVLDLEDLPHPISRRLETALAEDWRVLQASGRESLSQAIGRAAFEAGLEALLVPSHARPGRTNLVAFPQNFRAESSLRVLR